MHEDRACFRCKKKVYTHSLKGKIESRGFGRNYYSDQTGENALPSKSCNLINLVGLADDTDMHLRGIPVAVKWCNPLSVWTNDSNMSWFLFTKNCTFWNSVRGDFRSLAYLNIDIANKDTFDVWESLISNAHPCDIQGACTAEIREYHLHMGEALQWKWLDKQS